MHLEDKSLSRKFFVFIWITYTAVYMTKSCFSAALSTIVAEGVLTKAQTGFITSAFYLVYAILQIPGGVCADKFNPGKLITIGLIGGAIANTVIYFNQNYYVMLLAWVLNGVAQFALWPAVFKIVSSQLFKNDRKNMIFLIALASSAGLLLAYLVAAFVARWQDNFLISAITLFAFAIAVRFSYGKVCSYMVPEEKEQEKAKEKENIPTGKLFLASGFFALVPAILCVSMVDQGIKTLAPTMLMESYTSISASTGNLMGTFVIGAGILGMIVANFLYPRYIKKELLGYLGIIILSIPFSLVLCGLGKIRAGVIIAVMCVIIGAVAPAHMFSSQFNSKFSLYGKNGTAAGIANCAMSMAIVIESYGFNLAAENCGWITVLQACVVLLLIAGVLTTIAFTKWNKFSKE